MSNEGRLRNITNIGDGDIGIFQLINLESLKFVATLIIGIENSIAIGIGIRTNDGRINFRIFFTVVVATRIVIFNVEDDFVVQLLCNKCRSIGTIKYFEAVFEKCLTDIIDFTEEFN